jgi:class 3 adenylate cyclase
VVLPESVDYPPEFSNPELNLEAARALITELRDQEAELDRVLATVLFTDIVDSTATSATFGDLWRLYRLMSGWALSDSNPVLRLARAEEMCWSEA